MVVFTSLLVSVNQGQEQGQQWDTSGWSTFVVACFKCHNLSSG